MRLSDYDYSGSGVYFITICADERRCLFGDVVAETVRLSTLGRIVETEWLRSSEIRREVELDSYVVMPNHVHGIVAIDQSVHIDALEPRSRHRSLGSFVNAFKATTTRRVNELRSAPGTAVWQRNYYEHIVRSEEELNRIREYIAINPAKWAADRENPVA
jgi:REP element-mobilizing transposase RayT